MHLFSGRPSTACQQEPSWPGYQLILGHKKILVFVELAHVISIVKMWYLDNVILLLCYLVKFELCKCNMN